MLINFEDAQRSASSVELVRMCHYRSVGEGAEMVLHAKGNAAIAILAALTVMPLAHCYIHEDVNLAIHKVGGG